MKRQKVLVGYKTDLTTGVTFAQFRKEIVEDDGSITKDGTHLQTITDKDYDALKKLAFADVVNLAKTDALNKLALEKQVLENANLQKDTALNLANAEITKKDAEIAKKDAEIAELKKAKK